MVESIKLKKTIFLYGLFALILLFEFFVITESSAAKRGNLLQYLVLFNAILFLIIYIIDPFGSFCVILSSLPFAKSLPKFEIGLITFNIYTIGMVLLFVASVGKVIISKHRIKFTSTDLFILLVSITFIISTILSDNLIESGYLAFNFIFIPVLSYFVIRVMISNDAEYHQTIGFFLFGITILGIVACFNYLTSYQRAEPFGIFAIGAASLLIVPIFYIFYLSWHKNPYWLITLLIAIAGFIVTFSRMLSLIVLLSPLLLYVIKKHKSVLLYSMFFILTFTITLLVSYNADLLKPKFDVRFISKKQDIIKTEKRIFDKTHLMLSLYGRALSYKEGIERFRRTWLSGEGLFKQEGLQTYHNFHIEWLVYGGALGYLLYLLIFLSHVTRFNRIDLKDNFVYLNLLIIFSILCNSLMNGIMHGMMPYVIFITMAFNESRMMLHDRTEFTNEMKEIDATS